MARYARAAYFWPLLEFRGDCRQHRALSVRDLCHPHRHDVRLYRCRCDRVEFASPLLEEIGCSGQLTETFALSRRRARAALPGPTLLPLVDAFEKTGIYQIETFAALRPPPRE